MIKVKCQVCNRLFTTHQSLKRKFCSQKCYNDNSKLTAGINLSETDTDGNLIYIADTLATNFCGAEYTISGVAYPCYELSSCRLVDMYGNSQMVTCGQI